MLEASRKAGLEGIVGKKLASSYEPGRRSGQWVKVKNHMGQELVIAGWLEGEGKRRGLPGALLVGYYDNGELVYAGKVGTGFSDAMLEKLMELMKPLERKTSPFDRGKPPKGAHFTAPRLAGGLECVGWARGGQLRRPASQGLPTARGPAE